MEKLKFYKKWQTIKRRCYDVKHDAYKNYGARGIKVCDSWLIFENFYNDMFPTYKKGMWLDRLNNNGNYEPSNCSWVTPSQNNKNRRNSCTKQSNVDYVTFDKRNSKWSVKFQFTNQHEAEQFALKNMVKV